MAELDPLIRAHYEQAYVEKDRLFATPTGEWARLRTWDLFERFLPSTGRVLDVGGGPGIHSVHLASGGYSMTLVDPLPLHVEQARQRAGDHSVAIEADVAEARSLPFDDGSFDAALLMGPLYHLVSRDDRLASLREVRRVLKRGGILLAEVISRRAWLVDATSRGLLKEPGIFEVFELNAETGLSARREIVEARGSGFWAYFHRIDEIEPELREAGFEVDRLVAVEGFAWLLGDFAERLINDRDELLRATRMIEEDLELFGVSPHVMSVARKRGRVTR